MAFLAETSVKYAAQTPYMVDFAEIPVHVTAELLSRTPVRILRWAINSWVPTMEPSL